MCVVWRVIAGGMQATGDREVRGGHRILLGYLSRGNLYHACIYLITWTWFGKFGAEKSEYVKSQTLVYQWNGRIQLFLSLFCRKLYSIDLYRTDLTKTETHIALLPVLGFLSCSDAVWWHGIFCCGSETRRMSWWPAEQTTLSRPY